jgi:hypothetical protein
MLSQCDLQLALAGAGTLGKNVENQRRTIDHFDPEPVFQTSLLSRAKLVVKNGDAIRSLQLRIYDFLELPLANVGARVRMPESLLEAGNGSSPGRACKHGKLIERGIDTPVFRPCGVDCDENSTLLWRICVVGTVPLLRDVMWSFPRYGREPVSDGESVGQRRCADELLPKARHQQQAA